MRTPHGRPAKPLDDDSFWQRLGAESGRRNQPRMPSGDTPVRATLLAAWRAELRARRLALAEATEALTRRRAAIKRRIDELQAQASDDPRQAAALPVTIQKDRELAAEWLTMCDQYQHAIEAITERARECDAVWRAENERHRDRRMSIEQTAIMVPAEFLALPADPFA